ncbi:hypothetical protein CRG98_030297 [Punica granatum]|uniref:Uncharacterized protein n=1 Tax=Punica granatum TaxID=22663 RepID=A0A2I0IZE2_PUNGR|nr:hypothetical protein CRG98_030297 [Punica granatum]
MVSCVSSNKAGGNGSARSMTSLSLKMSTTPNTSEIVEDEEEDPEDVTSPNLDLL